MTALRSAPGLCALVALAALAPALAQEGASGAKRAPVSIESKTSGMQKLDGFLPLYWDDSAGKLHLEVPRLGEEMLFQVSLAGGLGSNPVGLDRGQLGDTQIVVFERVGPRVLLVARNYRYRADSENAAERRSVEDSFATSVLWGFAVEAVDGDRILVDATGFLLRDAHGISDALRRAGQGAYSLDAARSAIYLPRTKAFPKNTEIEVLLTFGTSGDPGKENGDGGVDPFDVLKRPSSSTSGRPSPSASRRGAGTEPSRNMA